MIQYEKSAKLIRTSNDVAVDAEIDNFTEGKSFDAFVANNKINMRWNGKTYVGNALGMEFTSPGPKFYDVKQGRQR